VPLRWDAMCAVVVVPESGREPCFGPRRSGVDSPWSGRHKTVAIALYSDALPGVPIDPGTPGRKVVRPVRAY
jgi:hypothetical protein